MPAAATIADEFALLVECLTPITDPRFARGKVHPLPGVLALVVLGLMAGCRSLSAISRYGRLHPEVLAPLGLRRVPSVATLHRLLQRVRVGEVRVALRVFVRRLAAQRHGAGGLTVAAVDGKTSRGTQEQGVPLHVLQVFAHRGALALDQAAAAPLHGEVEAAPRWVEAVAAAFPGLRVLTGDALFAEADLCRAVVASGRDDLIRLKKTNPPC